MKCWGRSISRLIRCVIKALATFITSSAAPGQLFYRSTFPFPVRISSSNQRKTFAQPTINERPSDGKRMPNVS
ncbi:MAG: hypothetical protein LUG18_01675 [Candidatus Azobacteroides sp.]|nr:hypothetical protein [Candidatus Azobacteroides sp.]